MTKDFFEDIHGKEYVAKWREVQEKLSQLKCPHEAHWKDESGNDRRTSFMFGLVEAPNNSFEFKLSKAVCCADFEEILKHEAAKLK